MNDTNEVLFVLAALLKHLGGSAEIPPEVLQEVEDNIHCYVRISQESPDSPMYLELNDEPKTH